MRTYGRTAPYRGAEIFAERGTPAQTWSAFPFVSSSNRNVWLKSIGSVGQASIGQKYSPPMSFKSHRFGAMEIRANRLLGCGGVALATVPHCGATHEQRDDC